MMTFVLFLSVYIYLYFVPQTPQVRGHACLKQDKEHAFVFEFLIILHEF